MPRVPVALGAGAMLAVAGTILQRLADNPLASPEVVGLSSGAPIGAVAVLCLVPEPARPLLVAASSAGAAMSLGLVVAFGYRTAFAGERLLMAKVATGTAPVPWWPCSCRPAIRGWPC